MPEHRRGAHSPIAPTLPKAWEETPSFHSQLDDWMRRTPWLALSGAAHLLLFIIVQSIPWSLILREEKKEIQVSLAPSNDARIEPPLPEDPLVVEEVPDQLDPQLVDVEVVSDELEVSEEADDESHSEHSLVSPLDAREFNSTLGIGGGAGPKFGGRFGDKDDLRGRQGRGTAPALEAGLRWLAAHQAQDGSWRAAAFTAQCGAIGAGICDQAGDPAHDVGLTGLVLLAFLGDGNTLTRGPHRSVVSRAVQWLRAEQDPDSGRFGEGLSHAFVYDHALATLAVCETYSLGQSALLRSTAKRAVGYILRARDPYGAWRYDVPSLGEADTSITGWMVFALEAADQAGLPVEAPAFEGALRWIDSVSDPATGRVGYDSLGSPSSRVPGINDSWPADKGEAMTAVGLLSRFFLDQNPVEHPIMVQHAELMLQRLPEWDELGRGSDMYYWYYGTYAMYQMGGRYWNHWNSAMKQAILPHQRKEGDMNGSWDPVGPWGWAGGRVYSTALMVLCLQVYYRYARVLGAR